MFRFRTPTVLLALACWAPVFAHAAPLSLDAAFERVTATHPELRLIEASRAGLEAEVAIAQQRPALTAGASLENALGTGDAAGVQGAEFTLSLASVLERGDKRRLRVDLAQQRLEGVQVLQEAKRLDLLAEVARRYLDGATAEAQIDIAMQDVTLREQAYRAAAERVAAGGAPVATRLAAEVALMRATAARAAAERARVTASRRLSALWGEDTGDLTFESAALAVPPPALDYAQLIARLAQTPELRVFANEARLREARLQLARSASTPDVAWEVGVRRMQETHDFGVVASISVPLGSASRAVPEQRVAQAELSALEFEREGRQRHLEATLAEVHGRLVDASAQASALGNELLPRLHEAESAAAAAYRRGALDYLEWAQLQGDTIAAEGERLTTTLEAYRALIELQRLTGASFSDAGIATGASTP